MRGDQSTEKQLARYRYIKPSWEYGEPDYYRDVGLLKYTSRTW